MKELGVFANRGGNVTLDAPFTRDGSTLAEYAKYIIVGTTGDLILEDQDGLIVFEPNRPAGYIIPFFCQRVLSSGTFSDIGFKITTATNITWRGGQ
jgi:hypothetical protein